MFTLRELLPDLRLRCDRGSGLYVTGDDCTDIPACFGVSKRGTLNVISLKKESADVFAGLARKELSQISELTRLLEQRKNRPYSENELICLHTGIKILETGGRSISDYEKLVRQTAAVAMRTNCGGLLYACALCTDLLRQTADRRNTSCRSDG